jgi:ribosomal protein S27E
MKVNCVSCGHNMMLDDAYDDFEGPVKCYVCGALLQVKTRDGKIKSVSLTGTPCQPPATKTEVDFEAVR